MRSFYSEESTFHIPFWTKVRKTKSEISMRTWRSPMSAALQGAFVVIPEIPLCDISYIIKKGGDEMIGVIGVIISLILLIMLAYKG